MTVSGSAAAAHDVDRIFQEDGPRSVPPGSSTIEYELIPDGNGTIVRFTHRDLPDAAAAESHAHGWDHYFERLAIVAGGGDPGVDPWISGPMS